MWIECVPNFSEGRDVAVLERLVRAVEAVPRTVLLDQGMDADHNRAVVTFAGTRAAVVESAFQACAEALRSIDMASHLGVHPRIGAMDVCPFVPLEGASHGDCRAAAWELGERIAAELAIPVHYYGGATRTGAARSLPALRRDVRAGCAPDAGPPVAHPRAGAVAIGVRDPLIAFNVELDGPEVEAAKTIAARIREANGGLPGLRALGFLLASKGIAQVSTNVCDVERTSLRDVFDAVLVGAQELGVGVRGSELVGLAPRAALSIETAEHVRLADFDPERDWIEARLERAGS